MKMNLMLQIDTIMKCTRIIPTVHQESSENRFSQIIWLA